MRAALSRSCAFGVVLVALAVLVAPALAAPDVPTNLTAAAVSDHEVDLSWQWPATAAYPDELQVWRNGAYLTSVPDVAQEFYDDPLAPSPDHDYSYQLIAVTAGVSTPVPGAVIAHTRPDAANPATAISATFAPVTNIATVSWTRGAMDSDVSYDVSATDGDGVTISGSVRYGPTDPPTGSLQLDGASPYTSYTFSVTATEDVQSSPPDPGGSVPGDSTPVVRSYDTIPPSFNGGVLTASRASLGVVSASWPQASDSGAGLARYQVCVDTMNCDTVSASSQSDSISGVPDDGLAHAVSVTAIDAETPPNFSQPITATVVMPVLQAPAISLAPGLGDGCSPLVPVLSSPDGTLPTFQLFVNGAPWTAGATVTGSPYDIAHLTAQATYGSDTSAMSPQTDARVGDLDGPETAPSVRGQLDTGSNTETLSWAPVTATGADVLGYHITSPNIPGFGGAGKTIPQSPTPQQPFGGLDQSDTYIVYVTAFDRCGRESADPQAFKFWLGDDVPPPTPTIASWTSTGSTVHLVWSPVIDNVQVDGYEIYRGSTRVGEVAGTATSFDDKGLPDGQTFSYKIRAIDTAGNYGSFSAVKTATTKDTTAPTPPGNPLPHANGSTVTISWSPAYDAVGVAGYQITRDDTIVRTVTGTSYVDTNVPAGPHVWDVRAFDAAGNLSAPRETPRLVTAAAISPVQASTLKTISPKGAKRWLRMAGKSGVRAVLTFKLSQTISPAVLHVRVMSGKAKLRISLPSGTGRTTAGKKLVERVVKKGTFALALGSMPVGTLRLIVTASKGTPLTLRGIGTAKMPSVGPKT